MALTLTGDGSITGLAVGGLPDLSVGTGDIADAAITAAKMSGAQSGDAPIYAARAWVNFNGTGTVAIRASGNVTSITDNGAGDYTVKFTTAMPDANYATVGITEGANATNTTNLSLFTDISAQTTTEVRVTSINNSNAAADRSAVSVVIFR